MAGRARPTGGAASLATSPAARPDARDEDRALTTFELREVAVLLAAAGAVGVVAHRLRISTVIGFLAVGVLLGPHAIGRMSEPLPWLAVLAIDQTGPVKLAAELGVALLLFMIGLELSFERLWRLRRVVFGLGGAQVVVGAVAIAWVARQFGNAPAVAVILGAALALSSTAVVMQLLGERGQLGSATGRLAFGILLAQDLAVVPLLFIVGLMGSGPMTGAALAAGIGLALGKAVLAIALILVLGRLVLRPVLRAVARSGSREAFLAAVLLTVLATAAATEISGLSLALGAFLAGLMLAETEFRPQIVVDIAPFKGFLLGVFFVSVGLGIDLAALAADGPLILLSALGLVGLKAAVLFALLRLARQPAGVAAEVALLLGQGGEFAFILITLALGMEALPRETAVFMTLVVGLTMAATPLLAALGRALALRLAPPGPVTALPAPEAHTGHVVIVGYGRVGRMVGELLDSQRIPHIAIDAHADRVQQLRATGAAVFYGDARRQELLAGLGAARAAALVVTLDQPEAVLDVVTAARATWPRLPIHARVRDATHARALLAAGASAVTQEVTEASLQLGETLLVALGTPDAAARHLVAARREAVRLALSPSAASDGD